MFDEKEKFERICNDRGLTAEYVEKLLVERGMTISTFVEGYNRMALEKLDEVFMLPKKVKAKKEVLKVVDKDFLVYCVGGAYGDNFYQFKNELELLNNKLRGLNKATIFFSKVVSYPRNRFSCLVTIMLKVNGMSLELARVNALKELECVASLNIPFEIK